MPESQWIKQAGDDTVTQLQSRWESSLLPSQCVPSTLKDDALWGLVLSVASGSMQALAFFVLPMLQVVKVRLGAGRKLALPLCF